MDKLSLNPPSLVATITATFQNRRFKLGDPIAYILKASPMTPTGRKKFELSANLSKYAMKWPKNDPKCPKVAQI